MEIAKGIHHFDTGPFNWYVIEHGGQLTLVDAGFPGHYAAFDAGLQSIGRRIADVAAVILTHAHADHLGFAARVGHEARATIFIHTADRAAAEYRLQLPWYGLLSAAWRPYTASMLLHATWNGAFMRARIRNTVPIEDGQVLDVPGRPHVIHVPGHTPGEVAFYLPDRGILFNGDTLVTRDLYTGAHGGPQVPRRLLNDRDVQAYQSLDRFLDMGEVTMLSGHGKPWQGQMTQAVAQARQPSGRRAAAMAAGR